jgi:putative ABC transport system ATP-binding protein
MVAEKECAIELSGVVKEYVVGGNRFRALDGISLRIMKGEFVSIMGPSGSGKSTLLHMLGCLDVPSSGEVLLYGAPLSKMGRNDLADARSRRIGFVFQAFNLATTFPVGKNVELPLMIAETPGEGRAAVVDKCLSIVGLTGKKANMPSELSGGEKQRVAIARALANSPEIILADEPTGNLDSKSGKMIMDTLSLLWKEHGYTVVVVTHEPLVAAYTRRQIRIRDGKVESDTVGKPAVNGDDIKLK